jgi:hypothetical protein
VESNRIVILRILHFLGNGLTDGRKIVRLTQQPRSTPQKHFSSPGINFSLRLSKPQGPVRLEGLDKIINIILPIRSRTRDLPAYSIMPRPLCYHVPLNSQIRHANTKSKHPISKLTRQNIYQLIETGQNFLTHYPHF